MQRSNILAPRVGRRANVQNELLINALNTLRENWEK